MDTSSLAAAGTGEEEEEQVVVYQGRCCVKGEECASRACLLFAPPSDRHHLTLPTHQSIN